MARAPWLLWDALVRGRYRFTLDLMPLVTPPMSMTKRWNLVRSGMNLLYRRLRPWSWPIHMQVEVTNYCNLRCPVCPTGTGILGRPAAMLDVDLYARLMAEVGPTLLTTLLWGWGEPLLHPQLAELIRITRSHGVIPITSTNGQVLHEERIQEDLLRQPPEHLIVAIDGLTEETNAAYRKGAKLAGVLDGVRRLARRKRELGQLLPVLHMRYMVMKHNQHERPRVEGFAAENGFDFLTIRALMTISEDDVHLDELVPTDPKYQGYNIERGRPKPAHDYACQYAFLFPGLQADGTIVPCDQDFRGSHPYGRLGPDGGFADIWFGRRAQELRRLIRRDRLAVSSCRNCPFADRKADSCSIELGDLDKRPATIAPGSH